MRSARSLRTGARGGGGWKEAHERVASGMSMRKAAACPAAPPPPAPPAPPAPPGDFCRVRPYGVCGFANGVVAAINLLLNIHNEEGVKI